MGNRKFMDIEKEIEQIKERNKRVEIDKSWEVSFVRRTFIASATYIIAVLWLLTINEDAPLLKAFIPMVGYILSTLSLSFVKERWIKR